MSDQPPINERPLTIDDLKQQMLSLLDPYLNEVSEKDPIQPIMSFLSSENGVGFFNAPYHQVRGSRFGDVHGLYLATTSGFPALLGFIKVVKVLYGRDVEPARMIALYMMAMFGRWADLSTGLLVYPPPGQQTSSGSVFTNAMVNAQYFDLCPMSCGEVQAITRYNLSKREMYGDHEQFTPEWYVMNEVMNLILVESGP